MGYSIFFSHSHKDAELAKEIKEHVEAPGDVNVYLYEEHSEPGRDVYGKLQAAIADHDALVALITPNSQPSPAVNQEIGFALALGKLAVAFVVPQADKGALAMLGDREYIDFDPADPIPGLTDLLTFVRLQREALAAARRARPTPEHRFGYVTPQSGETIASQRKPQDELVIALLLLGVAVALYYSMQKPT